MTIPIKQQIINRALSDVTLSGYLGAGLSGIMPRAGVHPDRDTTAPFVVLRVGAETATDELTARQFFTWYVYDTEYQAYWDIDAIIRRLRTLYDGYEGFAFDGRAWGRCEYGGASDEQVDDTWDKVFKTAQFSVPRI